MRLPLSVLAKLSFSLLLLGAVMMRVNFDRLSAYFHDMSLGMLAAALTLAALQVPVTSLRWHLLLCAVGVRLPLRTTVEVNILSIFANTVLVNVVGGIATRVGFLLGHDVATHNILSTSLLERLIIAVVLGGMAIIGLWMSGITPQLDMHMLVRVAALSLTGVGVLVLAAFALSKRCRTALQQIVAIVFKTLADVHSMAVNWRGMAVAVLLTVVSQVMLVGVGLLVGHVLHLAVPVWQMAMILPGVALISSLPIGLGGVGLREISMVTILAALGVSTEQSLVVSIMIGAVTLGGSALAYVLMLLVRGVERN